MSTLAHYVNKFGSLVKVINGEEIVCSPEHSAEVARTILERQNLSRRAYVVNHSIENATQRGLVLEQSLAGSFKTIPLSDLLPEKAHDARGTFHIRVEFVPDDFDGEKA